MPSNPDSGFHFRDAVLAQVFDENYGRDRRSIAAKQSVERYEWLMQEILQEVQVEESEAIALWSALNGASTSHPETLPILKQSVTSELKEDGHKDLALKVSNWHLCQWIAVVEACDRVGKGNNSISDLSAELKRVGLCK